jgi:hypothetical protein
LVWLGIERARALTASDEAQGNAVSRVLKARGAVVQSLRTKQEEILEGVRTKLEPTVKRLGQTQDVLISELKKAGVEIGG